MGPVCVCSLHRKTNKKCVLWHVAVSKCTQQHRAVIPVIAWHLVFINNLHNVNSLASLHEYWTYDTTIMSPSFLNALMYHYVQDG